MRRAVCPGSFDPITNGHLDVFQRAARQFDEVTVAVLVNSSKQGMFTVAERMDMLREATAHVPNIRVESFDGLLVDFCRERQIPVIVKGLRALTDFDYELQMAQMNYRLANIETLFVSTNPAFGYLSSSLVRDIAAYGGNVSGLVPDAVLTRLAAHFAGR